MLVLSRKKNESIVINDDITIIVVDIQGDKVRLGVEASKEVPVHRKEVYDAIRAIRRDKSVAGGKSDTPQGGETPPKQKKDKESGPNFPCHFPCPD